MSRYSIVVVAVWSFGVHAEGQDSAEFDGGAALDARAVCGNGTTESGEECDDGNTHAGDGCSSSCTVMRGYACIGEPSFCGLDCNENDLPDECDLDCAALDNACNVPDCGLSEDCNYDARPDECGVVDECLRGFITSPAALNANASYDSGIDYVPALATDGQGNWVAVWESSEDLDGAVGTDRDILFSVSDDDGITWTTPAALNANAASDWGNDYSPQVTTDRQGTWSAMWDSYDHLGGTIGTDDDILFSVSTDNGISWTYPTALNRNAASDSNDNHLVHLTTDGRGNWLAIWDSWEDPDGASGEDPGIFFSRFRSVGEDCNCNGVADACEAGTGDVDGDGFVNVMDYAGFADCITGPPTCIRSVSAIRRYTPMFAAFL
ncbi:MAG: hypothetical protein JSU63_18475 [Phycisphaerales bacterium]|nr:MAG: hypothetical protein JSU63_18475 [Phycisphaerales bacterium]